MWREPTKGSQWKKDVSSGKEKAQSNGGKDGKETEQWIIWRQKRWERNKWK